MINLKLRRMKEREKTILEIRFRKFVESMELYGLSETGSGKGFLNPWVTGLLLSSAVMDEIQIDIPYNTYVTWGQVLNDDDTLSGEIDIIYHLGKPIYEWKRIGFAIVKRENILRLFEVKRTFKSYDKHREDYAKLRLFGTDICLIIYGTHTSLTNVEQREEKLRQIGYKDAFHLVRWTKRRAAGIAQPIIANWLRFIKTVREL